MGCLTAGKECSPGCSYQLQHAHTDTYDIRRIWTWVGQKGLEEGCGREAKHDGGVTPSILLAVSVGWDGWAVPGPSKIRK